MILNIWNAVWPYLVAILLFVLLIVIHEFGHFIVAKACGIKVNQFAVGFGPRLLKKQIGETEYSIRLLPFGGFCSMEGEDDESSDPRAFCNKKAWQRFLVVAAGAVFNIILGLILALCIVLPQKEVATPRVAKFVDSSVSSEYGLAEGDLIVKANGRRVFTTYDLSYMLSTDSDGLVDFVVDRNGKKVELNSVKFNTENVDGKNYIKIDFYVYGEERTFGSVIKNTFMTALSYGRIVYMSLFDMITGKFGLNDISGPVGITVQISNAVKYSISSLFGIACLITINLGIMNLLPLPALDGGRLLFILFEMVFKKPVPSKYESWVHAIGLILLLAFAVLITFNDIFRLIKG